MLPAGRVVEPPAQRGQPELTSTVTRFPPAQRTGRPRTPRPDLRITRPARISTSTPGRGTRLVCAAAALLTLIAVAGARTSAEQARGQAALDQAGRSRLRATAHLSPVDPAALRADLLDAEQQARIARGSSGGPAWTVLSQLPGNHLRATRAGSEAITMVAAASPQLRRDLQSLAAPGSPPIAELRGLASSLEAYAVAVRQSRPHGQAAPEADAADRAATAAALLPGLAGQDHARQWLICPSASSSPCTGFQLEPGTGDGIPVASGIRPQGHSGHRPGPLAEPVVVRGFDARRVLSPPGSTAAGWRPVALLNLLIGLNLSDGVSVSSPEPAEQSVIDRLARG